jgi:hypothetical protein
MWNSPVGLAPETMRSFTLGMTLPFSHLAYQIEPALCRISLILADDRPVQQGLLWKTACTRAKELLEFTDNKDEDLDS